MYILALSLLLLCNFVSCQPQSLDSRPSDQCYSFVEGPFGLCSKLAGYNATFKFPDTLTHPMLIDAAAKLRGLLYFMQNCSRGATAEALLCSFFIPQCSKGQRVYPCKRVCGEFLKQCDKRFPRRAIDYIIAACHILPDEKASSGKCFEPPNFTTNDSIKGPLDRGCQPLIIPACKNLGVSNHTLITVDQQQLWYLYTYKKSPLAADLETDFPPKFREVLQRYPKCQQNLKKMFCGEYFPPCFPDEGHGYYSICRSVCDDIARDCPEFFRNASFLDVEYCALLGKGNSSHGYCKRTEWPPPFSWTRYMIEGKMRRERPSKESPSKGPKPKSVKTWVIVVSVLVVFIVVGVIFVGAVCLKWRRDPTSGYKKQEDDMTAPLETSVDL